MNVARDMPDTPGSESWTLKMRDLCEASGLGRQTVHFYIQKGLLPPGRKTGRNMAYYGAVHLERLRIIQKLQHERFLPLKAIKALFDGDDAGEYSAKQRAWIGELKEHVASTLGRGADHPASVDAAELFEAHGVAFDELRRLDALGIVPAHKDAAGRWVISADDVWLIKDLGELRRLGFTVERGYDTADMAFYEDVMTRLVEYEIVSLRERLGHLPAAEVARMVERALPLLHRFLAKYHESKIRRFFAAMSPTE